MIEAYNNKKGVSSFGNGDFKNCWSKTKIEVNTPERIKKDLKDLGFNNIPEKVIITDKSFTDFDNWQGYFYF